MAADSKNKGQQQENERPFGKKLQSVALAHTLACFYHQISTITKY
jgi:hypothetical protein